MAKKHKNRKPTNADMRAMTKPEVNFDDFLATNRSALTVNHYRKLNTKYAFTLLRARNILS